MSVCMYVCMCVCVCVRYQGQEGQEREMVQDGEWRARERAGERGGRGERGFSSTTIQRKREREREIEGGRERERERHLVLMIEHTLL